VVSFLTICGLVYLTLRVSSSGVTVRKEQLPQCWCGTSNEEAIEMDCVYDHIAVDWLPRSCIDHELVREFDKAGPGLDGAWPYYERDGTLSLRHSFMPLNETDIDELAREGKDYYATREWHIVHCMFVWRKQFRAVSNGISIETWNNNEDHIKHCTEYILTALRVGARLEDIDTIILGEDRHVDARPIRLRF
jgi:hypothetical protein